MANEIQITADHSPVVEGTKVTVTLPSSDPQAVTFKASGHNAKGALSGELDTTYSDPAVFDGLSADVGTLEPTADPLVFTYHVP